VSCEENKSLKISLQKKFLLHHGRPPPLFKVEYKKR